jgi:hypothetical protein
MVVSFLVVTHSQLLPLIRTDPKAQPLATIRIRVQAPNYDLAKHTAEAQYPGYRASVCTR